MVTQAGPDHSSVACLLDRRGRSYYLGEQNQNQGAARDLSISIFHCAGDGSTFEGLTRRLATSVDCSIAMFTADRGENRYIRLREDDEAFGFAMLLERKPGLPGWAFFRGGAPQIKPPDPRFRPNAIGWNQAPGRDDQMTGGYMSGDAGDSEFFPDS